MLVLEQLILSVSQDYFFSIQMLLIFGIIFWKYSFWYKKTLFFSVTCFLSWRLLLCMWYLFSLLVDLFFKWNSATKAIKNNWLWWHIWATGCLFIFLQTWLLQTDLILWSSKLVFDCCYTLDRFKRFRCFNVSCEMGWTIEVAKYNTGFANNKILN